jgi:hypothetical protein
VRRTYPLRDFLFQNRADNLQSRVPRQLLDLGLQFLPHLDHRQRHLHQQLPVSHYLKLLLGLASCSLIGFPHSGSPFQKKSSHPNSIRVRARAAAFLFRFQLREGQLRPVEEGQVLQICTGTEVRTRINFQVFFNINPE